jgi:hypothetical protein
MTTDQETRDTSSPPPTEETWRKQLDNGLEWLNNRAWPLTAFVLFISVICLFSFTQQEHVPLSITSPAAITSLPALMSLTALIVASLVGVIILPAFVLIVPVWKDRSERLIDLLPQTQKSTKTMARPAERLVAGYWLGALVYFASILGALASYDIPERFNFGVWNPIFLSVGILAILVIPVGGFYLFIRYKLEQHGAKNVDEPAGTSRTISGNFLFISFFGALAQFILIIWILTWSGRGASGTQFQWMLFASYVCLAALALFCIQFIGGSVLTWLVLPQFSLKRVAIFMGTLVTLLLAFPQSGASLASAAFQLTGSGGRACVVLTWADGKADSGYAAITNKDDQNESKRLRIILEADGIYRVREVNSTSKRKIYLVPMSDIAAVDECPRPEAKHVYSENSDS